MMGYFNLLKKILLPLKRVHNLSLMRCIILTIFLIWIFSYIILCDIKSSTRHFYLSNSLLGPQMFYWNFILIFFKGVWIWDL